MNATNKCRFDFYEIEISPFCLLKIECDRLARVMSRERAEFPTYNVSYN